jgi:acyl-CoA synthetase (AMP-forming)/AMP-acid ligase II
VHSLLRSLQAPRRRHGLPAGLVGLPATIPELLAARAADADLPFVLTPDSALTYAEADARSAELARRLLAAGVGKGTRTALLYGNGPDWVVTWLAITRIGALSVPLSTFSPGTELARAIRHADVHALLSASRFANYDLAERLVDAHPDLDASGAGHLLALSSAPFLRWIHVDGDEAPPWSPPLPEPIGVEVLAAAEREVAPADSLVIISTSGTTAAPKAVVHTQGSMIRHAALLARRREFDQDDRIYSPMPFFWVGGLTMVVLAAMTSGAAAVVHERFDAGEALELAERHRVTQISCWPNAARAMAEHPTCATRDLSAVRGGTLVEALPFEHRPPSPDRAPMPLGMTETGGPHTTADHPYAPVPAEHAGTFGRSQPGVEHCVVDAEYGDTLEGAEEGELLVRGPFVMRGLYKQERHDTFTPDGWYATGDLGWFDLDGYLHFGGRRTTMIKSGGSNVAPAEVEAALCAHPEVRAAFAFGVPAGDRGEDVVAVVAVGPDVVVTAEEVVAHARAALSSYKVPRRIDVVEESELPMLPNGKADLMALRARFDRSAT